MKSWQSRGPNNIDPVLRMDPTGTGAASAVFMRANSKILFLGSVNGGVWRTNNFDSRAPHYIPLTDKNLCQSVSTLAGSLEDPNFIAYG
ncbi:unnamed protein product [Rotaria sp. Silwood1]|nr:unnamed protein product [Rotaria sp. Silwood1]CAF1655657.1 unnamed protein product [Rotaria sp. Silwood1]CAF5046063.1 unnamed protein product [Rotaria sp. Silwood1]